MLFSLIDFGLSVRRISKEVKEAVGPQYWILEKYTYLVFNETSQTLAFHYGEQ